MIKIKINQEHKSIKPCEFELPDFTVLTGKNGSGKSHLLQAISTPAISSKLLINSKTTYNIEYIPFNGLNPNIEEVCDPQTIKQQIKSVWQNYDNRLRNLSHSYSRNQGGYNVQNFLNQIGVDNNQKRIISKVIEKTHKELDKITEDDFDTNFDISFINQNDFFTAQFALIFKNYHLRYEENAYNEFCKEKGKPLSKPILTESEFVDKYGTPPWDLINQILKETNVPYEVNNPMDTRMDSS
ncbi:hypothetical protein EZS27_038939, partial [termite gut metagenome]